MVSGIPFILPIVFGVSLIIALVIYLIGGKISAKGTRTSGGSAPYSCGEEGPVGEVKVNLERFLTFATYFLIFDVLAFVLVTSYYSIGIMPVLYALIVLSAVGMLLFARKRI
jgi:NADH:ubiquinone oxidoreductase subunit 3 (subunit A)